MFSSDNAIDDNAIDDFLSWDDDDDDDDNGFPSQAAPMTALEFTRAKSTQLNSHSTQLTQFNGPGLFGAINDDSLPMPAHGTAAAAAAATSIKPRHPLPGADRDQRSSRSKDDLSKFCFDGSGGAAAAMRPSAAPSRSTRPPEVRHCHQFLFCSCTQPDLMRPS